MTIFQQAAVVSRMHQASVYLRREMCYSVQDSVEAVFQVLLSEVIPI